MPRPATRHLISWLALSAGVHGLVLALAPATTPGSFRVGHPELIQATIGAARPSAPAEPDASREPPADGGPGVSPPAGGLAPREASVPLALVVPRPAWIPRAAERRRTPSARPLPSIRPIPPVPRMHPVARSRAPAGRDPAPAAARPTPARADGAPEPWVPAALGPPGPPPAMAVGARAPAPRAQTGHRTLLALLHREIDRHKRYPGQARRSGRQGTATVVFELRPDGDVAEPAVAVSSGFRALDRAALRAVEGVRPFAPARQHLSEALRVQVQLEFRLR